MAGNLAVHAQKPQDILFDIVLEDDEDLNSSELIQLVNFGQFQNTVKLPGADGTTYKVDLALLWDEDHIDILKRTTAFAGDPLLRVRVIRKLKLHASIQRINDVDFSDKQDSAMQRKLWVMLSRLSDRQMDRLDELYNQTALERDIMAVQAFSRLADELTETSPKEIRPKKKDLNTATGPENIADNEHANFISSQLRRQDQEVVEIKDVLLEKTGLIEGESAEVVSPKQNPNAELSEEGL